MRKGHRERHQCATLGFLSVCSSNRIIIRTAFIDVHQLPDNRPACARSFVLLDLEGIGQLLDFRQSRCITPSLPPIAIAATTLDVGIPLWRTSVLSLDIGRETLALAMQACGSFGRVLAVDDGCGTTGREQSTFMANVNMMAGLHP
jgi:hypothetical protein